MKAFLFVLPALLVAGCESLVQPATVERATLAARPTVAATAPAASSGESGVSFDASALARNNLALIDEAEAQGPQPVKAGIAFVAGPKVFRRGDAIIVREVIPTPPEMAAGSTVVVRGRYILTSELRAAVIYLRASCARASACRSPPRDLTRHGRSCRRNGWKSARATASSNCRAKSAVPGACI